MCIRDRLNAALQRLGQEVHIAHCCAVQLDKRQGQEITQVDGVEMRGIVPAALVFADLEAAGQLPAHQRNLFLIGGEHPLPFDGVRPRTHIDPDQRPHPLLGFLTVFILSRKALIFLKTIRQFSYNVV